LSAFFQGFAFPKEYLGNFLMQTPYSFPLATCAIKSDEINKKDSHIGIAPHGYPGFLHERLHESYPPGIFSCNQPL